jgi:hypothetical protein
VWGRGESRDRGLKRMGYKSTFASPTPVCIKAGFVSEIEMEENAIFYLIRVGIFPSLFCITNAAQVCTVPFKISLKMQYIPCRQIRHWY